MKNLVSSRSLNIRLASLLVLVTVVACTPPAFDPCPPGSEPSESEDRCVELGVIAPDAGMTEDAGVSTLRCELADVNAWRAFHQGGELVTHIRQCEDKVCAAPPCELSACVMEVAGVDACDDCVKLEGDCTDALCRSACRNGNDKSCLECACDHGCIAKFEDCSGASLGLCADLHGRDADAVEYQHELPVILRRKSETGFTRRTIFNPEQVESEWTTFSWHWGAKSTLIEAFTLDGVQYVLDFIGDCEADECLVRISPLLNDGTYGNPAYEGKWDKGWDRVRPFTIDGTLYLIRYKTGFAAELTGEPRGIAIVDRIERASSDPGASLVLTQVSQRLWTSPTQAGFHFFEFFQLDGETYVLQQGAERGGELRISQVTAEGDQIRVNQVGAEITWETPYAIVHTFQVGGTWFVLQYAGSAHEASGVNAGDVRVSPLVHGPNGTVVVGPAIYEAQWLPGWTAIRAFATSGASYLLRQNQMSGRVEYVRLPAQSPDWQSGSLEGNYGESWGVYPYWDQVAVANSRQWHVD